MSAVRETGRRVLNPVLLREIKERMRSPRAFWILVVYLGLVSLLMYGSYRGALAFLRFQGLFSGGAFTGATLGRTMFEWTLFALIVLITFIAPGIAAGSITSEKERRTLHLVQITLLRPSSIALGKMGTSLAFLLVLLVASAPLFMVPLVLGGVTVWQVIKGFLVVVAWATFLVALGTWISSLAKRVQFAIVAAYVLTFVISIGSLILVGVETMVTRFSNTGQRPVSVYISPLPALADATIVAGIGSRLPVPLSPFGELLYPGSSFSVQPGLTGFQQGPSGFQSLPPASPSPAGLPVWPVHVVLLLLLSALLILGASARLRLPSPRFSLGKGDS